MSIILRPLAMLAVLVVFSGVSSAQMLDLEQQWLDSNVAGRGDVDRVAARFGKGWSFVDAESPVVLDSGVNFPHAFSLETWFRLDDVAGRSALFSSAAWRRFVVSIANGSYVDVSYYDRGAEPTLRHHSFGYTFQPGRWYHFVVTADAEGGIRFYINGELAQRLPAFTGERRKSDVGVKVIGAYSINGSGAYDHFFRGVIDRPLFTGRAWSEADVRERYDEAIHTLPVTPIPTQVTVAGEPLRGGGGASRVRLVTELVTADAPRVAMLNEAIKGAQLGGEVVLSDARSSGLPDHVRAMIEGDLPQEGYILSIRQGRIDIVGADARGLTYGIDTLRQLLALPEVPQVDVYDYPQFPYRAGLIVTNNQPPASLKDGFGGISLRQTIQDFADHRINGLMVRIYNWAWLDDEQNFAQAKEIIDYAKKYHLDVIPYLQCYGHAKMFTWRDIRADHTRTIHDEEVTLSGQDPAALKTPNVIITSNTPVLVHLADGTDMSEGRDFEVITGEVKTSWVPPKGVEVDYPTWGRPYVHPDSEPFAIRRLPGSRISDGATVRVTYDVAANSREYCPFSPVTHELVDDTIRRVIELTDADYINLGMDEMWTPISRDGRCCAPGADMPPAEVFRREINRTLAVAQEAKPGIKVMYWSDMIDANQTPHWMPTWEAVDEEVEKIDRQAVMMPWYYGGRTSDLWKVGESIDRFLGRGFGVMGASGHDTLNQFVWADAVRSRPDRQRIPGFTFTTWSSSGKSDALQQGYRAFAQATWSPSRTPFDKLVQLRVELNALGVTAGLDDKEWTNAAGNVTEVQRDRLARLLSAAEAELTSVDSAVLAELKIPGVDEMLTGVSQARRLMDVK